MRLRYFILFFLFSSFSYGQDLNNLKEEVHKILEFDYNLNFEEEEGLWIGVIDEDSTFIFSVGNITTDSLTSFQLGSVSKIFTADMVLNSLKEAGINTHQKISNYFELNEVFDKITIDQLLTHRSGLPKEAYFFGKHNKNPDNPYEHYPDDLIVPELNKYDNLYKEEQLNNFNYGHLNYALLGLVVEQIKGNDFCQLVQESYNERYASLNCSDMSTNLSIGYDKAGNLGTPWSFSGFAPSQGLSMNVIDLTDYLRAEFEKDDDVESLQVSKTLSLEAPWYVVKQKRNKKIHSFSGTTSIHSVFVCFNKENKTAVVMMRNSGKGILHLPLTILSMVDDSKKKNK